MGSSVDADVIIVGAGIAGLSCARRLMKENISFLLLEAGGKIGERLKTENVDGFRLNYGFRCCKPRIRSPTYAGLRPSCS